MLTPKRIAVFLCCVVLSSTIAAQPGSFVTQGAVLAYESFGKGTPVLIINGGPGMNSEGFKSLALILAKNNFRAIIYDQRGNGKSVLKEVTSSTVTMDLMRDDIEALRIHLKINQWIVLGHSFGGILANYYASKYPDRISKLVLSSSGGIDLAFMDYINASIQSKLTKQERDSLDYWTSKTNNGDTSFNAKWQRARWLAPAYLYNKTFVPLIAQRLTVVNMHINQLVFTDLRKINYDCSETLKKLTAPVLIIQGKNDIIKAETAQKASGFFSNVTVKIVPDCGHYGWLEQPGIYVDALLRFLQWKV